MVVDSRKIATLNVVVGISVVKLFSCFERIKCELKPVNKFRHEVNVIFFLHIERKLKA